MRAGAKAGNANTVAFEVGDGAYLRTKIATHDKRDGGKIGKRGDHLEVASVGAERDDVVDGVGGKVDAVLDQIAGSVGACAEGIDVHIEAGVLKVVQRTREIDLQIDNVAGHRAYREAHDVALDR